MDYKRVVSEIKAESVHLKEKTQEELTIEISKTKEYLKKEKKNQNFPINKPNLGIIKWFSLVQEISYRQLGLKHYDTQLLAGLYLNEGKIVEMKTGEGKTLASTLPISFNALSKKGVHVVTVNEYLAERDKEWMGKIYNGLNLSVGLIKSVANADQKRKNYNEDITYVTNSDLVFDYLRDSSCYFPHELVQRPLDFCIIDEIDSILIDEARTPLIISVPKEEKNPKKKETMLSIALGIANRLKKNSHFEIDEKKRDVYLTEKGYNGIVKLLAKKTLFDAVEPWILVILNALKAKHVYKVNKDYLTYNEKVFIIDEYTGRTMEDRRWSFGIHEAIEKKENLPRGEETTTKTSITYQNFFTLYPKLSGMTGTAKTAEQEFQDIYNLKVVVIPTEKKMIRTDLDDAVYFDQRKKWGAVIKQICTSFEKEQPILIGTSSIENSELLSELLKKKHIPHEVLNAKPENVARESEIISQAGTRKAVTIATNLAGRGTDILLGGNPSFQAKKYIRQYFIDEKDIQTPDLKKLKNLKEKKEIEIANENQYINTILLEYKDKEKQLKEDIQNLPYSLEKCKPSLQVFYKNIYKLTLDQSQKENKYIKELGGLFVLGTERFDTRRIDDQLRGRAGRQGDPGISQFVTSLDDNLLKIFGGAQFTNMIKMLKIDNSDTPLEAPFLTKSLAEAQKKIEALNYESRKNVFDYDIILNEHRQILFEARREYIEGNPTKLLLLVKELNKKEETTFFLKFAKICLSYRTGKDINNHKGKIKMNKKKIFQEGWITQYFINEKAQSYKKNLFLNNDREEFLKIIDLEWAEHNDRTNYIRETINWTAYGQQNPLIEYNLRAAISFKEMFRQIRQSMLNYNWNRKHVTKL